MLLRPYRARALASASSDAFATATRNGFLSIRVDSAIAVNVAAKTVDIDGGHVGECHPDEWDRAGEAKDRLARRMTTILRRFGFRFFFYSGEGSEPPHIHVEHGDKVAKYWLDPVVLAGSESFRSHELTRLRSLVNEHRTLFLEKWHEHFGNST